MKAKHFSKGKLGLQYILAMPIVDEMARVMDYGNAKYGNYWNYLQGMEWMELLGSCARHLTKFIRGENNDKESGLSHLAHMACDAGMLFDYLGRHTRLDNRRRKC